MKHFLGGSAVLTTVFLSASFAFYAPTSVAPLKNSNNEKKEQTQDTKQELQKNPTKFALSKTAETKDKIGTGASLPNKAENKNEIRERVVKEEITTVEKKSDLIDFQAYTATAYSLRGRTASGRGVARGIIAADPRVLPLGSKVKIEAGNWSGEYLVADTGGSVKGRKIDVWVPSTNEAMQFGRRTVKLSVLTYGVKRAKTSKSSGPKKAQITTQSIPKEQ